MDIFTNREKAILFYSALVIIWFLSKKEVRSAIYDVIKNILNIYILIPICLYLGYFSFFLILFHHFELWDIEYLKDAIIWFVFTGFQIVFLSTTKKSRLERDFWKHQILENLKIPVFLEIYVNLFSFSLQYELLIILFISLVVLMNTVLEHHNYDDIKYAKTKKLIKSISTLFGTFILIYTLYRTIIEINSIVSTYTLKIFMFPLVYSIISLIFSYVFIVYCEYDRFYRILKDGNKRSKKLNFQIMLKLFVFCNIQIEKLKIASNLRNYNLRHISSENEIDVMIGKYKEVLAMKR